MLHARSGGGGGAMMMRLSEAARAIGGELRGEDREFEGVSTDSRALPPGGLFVALEGERFDGHSFLAQAAAAGAAGVLVRAGFEIRDSGFGSMNAAITMSLVVVPDTRLALGALAAYWRGRFHFPLVALTGSNGKTTVKEMLAAILCGVYDESPVPSPESRVLATRGNLNNDIGLPLTLLELRSVHRCAVIEMGMNHAGEIRYLGKLARPDVALVTNAGPVHIEFFDSVADIARAKGEIFEHLADDGTAVINADDRYAGVWRDLAAGRRVVEFGLEHAAPVTARYTLRNLESEIVVKTPLGEAAAVLKVPGVHNVRNALAASAAAHALAVPAPQIAAGLARFAGVKGRLQRKSGMKGATLIDDTYNANPESARAAIDVLAQAPGRRLLVLGDMGELGRTAAELHAGVGEHARECGIDGLFALGAISEHAARAFGTSARHFDRIEDLIEAAWSELAPDTTVLVKGSRFMRMERVVGALSADGDGGRATRDEGKL
jgi:UDP-N-acetylmuramoyl-tripeptide--D-alanyl-D-alanine ligase